MTSISTEFHLYTQEQALSIFLPLLRPHLPFSNAIYNRLQCPLNVPSRQCIFAATFPHTTTPSSSENYTILFADRSRHNESQLWFFNSLPLRGPISPEVSAEIPNLMRSIVGFVRGVERPEADGWPFQPLLKLACVHETFATALIELAKKKNKSALVYGSLWEYWSIDLSMLDASQPKVKEDVRGLTVSRVPEAHLDQVISWSSIPRQKETLRNQASACLINGEGTVVAWAFIGLDGSLCTLHVLSEFRGRGLAKWIVWELLTRVKDGAYRDLGVGCAKWVHAEVGEGNAESKGVMVALGGRPDFRTGYLGLNLEEF